MGVAICSKASDVTSTSRFLLYTKEWHIPDSDTEDAGKYIELPKMSQSKSISLPAYLGKASEKTCYMGRAKTERVSRVRGYSLEERMRNWQQSSVVDRDGEKQARSLVVDREGEKQAEQYAKMVADDTLSHLHHTVRVAGSIIEKGIDIKEELDRQENVLCKADHDISMAEYETDRTSETLRGMTLKGKLRNVTKRRKPKMKPKAFNRINLDLLNGEPELNAFSRMDYRKSLTTSRDSSEDNQQHQIKKGIVHLHEALDVITEQQLDTIWSHQRQHGRLSVFEDKIGGTRGKIKRQSERISRILY